MARSYWLVKSEPFKYSWDRFVRDGSTYWDGVRNYEARNNVGVARVTHGSYPDPTADDEQWVVVDVKPLTPLEQPVSLKRIKSDPALAQIQLIRRARLSVVPVMRAEFDRILRLGKTRLPRG
jgi:predicted RNA-binding protein with PUA-like domain